MVRGINTTLILEPQTQGPHQQNKDHSLLLPVPIKETVQTGIQGRNLVTEKAANEIQAFHTTQHRRPERETAKRHQRDKKSIWQTDYII